MKRVVLSLLALMVWIAPAWSDALQFNSEAWAKIHWGMSPHDVATAFPQGYSPPYYPQYRFKSEDGKTTIKAMWAVQHALVGQYKFLLCFVGDDKDNLERVVLTFEADQDKQPKEAYDYLKKALSGKYGTPSSDDETSTVWTGHENTEISLRNVKIDGVDTPRLTYRNSGDNGL